MSKEQELLKEIEALLEKKEYNIAHDLYIKFKDKSHTDNALLNRLLKITSNQILKDGHSSLHNLRGTIYHDLKNFDKAIEEYLIAQSINPNISAFYYNMGLVYYDMKDLDKALECYNKAVEIDPKNSDAYNNIALIYSHKGDLKNAIENYTKAIESDATYSLAYFNRGKTYSDLREFDKAINDYTKAIELNPKGSGAYYNRGIIFQDRGKNDKAIEDYTKAIEFNPQRSDAYNNRGLVYGNLDNQQKAIDDYSKAIEVNPSYILAYFNRGILYKKLRQYKKALTDFETCVQLNNDDHWVEQAKWNINDIQKILNSNEFKDIHTAVDQIKSILKYNEDEMLVTHYTGMTAAKILLTYDDPKFRLSEGNYMNDTSEGEILRGSILENNYSGATDFFINKPFLGSFIPKSNNHSDNLTLWRMYAKSSENMDGCGCSITLDGNRFLQKIENLIFNTSQEKRDMEKLEFYKVAYLNQQFQCIGGYDYCETITRRIQEIKSIVKNIKGDDLKFILEKLSEIDYLFKGEEYAHENEVRLVIPDRFIDEYIKIDKNMSPPRVYLETINIRPFVKSITIGPKVERAEEWACVFNHVMRKEGNKDVEIRISTLPYK